ncbi:hypothetical protein CWIS_11480 [Cellulomonas sp. A375-1]|uniref:Lycopene cyclase domain-containing protein n=1 Tax=Cellulomonas gelida TaxID=1712 RepID=A0A4Y3KNZ5_9CELL|nr:MULTISPECIES: lycopene cyclase domain-containing protein [Cellulomonas]KMM45351.1 hypothetical protein CWIS_11480 [Cellulomonas sp. A375-1]MCR6703580.1 lycopene cyclase domain-containing protein [Cellulomonas sp.]GEA85376.1 hypothetical protein CGE01nite_26270 [Cellulomonas gelida]GGL36234.1 hypothetical protein GCM10009774_28560 [Cellulomonas gelida]
MTYAGLAVVVVLACAAVTAFAVTTEPRRGRPRAHLLAVVALTALVLGVLTVVFDSVMVTTDLFRYDEAALLGWRVLRAPVEDLAWPLATALLLPSLAALHVRKPLDEPADASQPAPRRPEVRR